MGGMFMQEYANKLIVDVDDHPSDVFASIARQSSSFRARWYHRLQALQARLITNNLLKKVKHSFSPSKIWQSWAIQKISSCPSPT